MKPDPRIVKQAIHWMLRLRESGNSPALQQQCEQWRSADHQHELAWQRVHTLQQEFDLRAMPGAGVALQALETGTQRLQRRQALKLLGGLAMVGSAAWLGKDLALFEPWSADFATATGEQRHVRLPDDSLLQLNTHSAVDLDFDERQRKVTLKHGEIMLACTPRPDRRPLLVSTRDTLLEGLQGRFVVRQESDCTLVSVGQGSVAIHSPSRGRPYWVRSGEAVRVDALGILPATVHDMDATAWTEGLIVTRNMRLGDFITEVGRYRRGYLGCSSEIADLRLSGVFRLADTDKLLQLLPQTLPVRVSYHTRWWVRLDRLA